MKLTVGMIVKNEEKYLERCLNGIKPILDCVDSELIITDTGSTDKTVEIAEKYADKVLHFEWINDFAAARNTAVEIAKGEWFMFLDADEIFPSCENIIDFFNSGEYKNYNSATFIIKNLSENPEAVSEFRAQRLTRLTPKTRFVGIVHELLNTFGNPIRHLEDKADHYGYLFSDKAEAEKKSLRNTKLLLKRLDTERPTDPMIFVQLYDSFMTGGETVEANKYMERGIVFCKKNKSLVLSVLYVNKAYAFVSSGNYEAAVGICREHLNMDRSIRGNGLTSDKEIYAILASSYLRMKNYADAERCFIKFFDIFEKVESGVLDTGETDAISFRASAEFNYIPFVNAFLNCCCMNGHYDTAAQVMSKIPVYKHIRDDSNAEDTVKILKKILDNGGAGYLEALTRNLDVRSREILEGYAGKTEKQNPEMERLAVMLKSNIRKMIKDGNIVDARKYLSEYSGLVPSDPEINELADMINNS